MVGNKNIKVHFFLFLRALRTRKNHNDFYIPVEDSGTFKQAYNKFELVFVSLNGLKWNFKGSNKTFPFKLSIHEAFKKITMIYFCQGLRYV